MTVPIIQQPLLSTSTIVPENDFLFIPYLNRLYEEIAYTVNNKENVFFEAQITDTAASIPNLPLFGAFIICVSGAVSTLPTITASLCKADATAAGSIAVLGSQVGTGAWAGNALTITSTATNFQIAHNRAGVIGNFNIKIIGTQGL
jgi:hypothetical protein